MSTFSIVTLSGVITDPRAGLNYIMSCFFFSKYSQTDLYRGNVISLPEIIKRSGDSTTDIATETESGLERLLSRYFPVVNLEVDAVDDGANIEISIKGYIIAVDSTGEKRLDVGYVLSTKDGTFRKIVDVINEEVLY